MHVHRPQPATRRGSTAISEVDELTPIVCAECRATYLAPVKDRNSWICPRCGPSLPIETEGQESSVSLDLASRWRPRVRIPLFLVQLAIIALLFGVFLAVANYLLVSSPSLALDDGTRQGPDMAAQPATPAMAATTDDEPPTVAAATVDSSAPATPSVAIDDERPTSAGGDDPATTEPAAVRVAPATETVPFELSQLPLGTLTLSDFVQQARELVGREARIACRVTQIDDEVGGWLPHSYQLNGEQIQLSTEDEPEFRRIYVVDAEGQEFSRIFVRPDGRLSDDLAWVLPGDWLILEGTPGKRFDRFSSQMTWGLIVTKILPVPPLVPNADPPAAEASADADGIIADRPAP